MDEDEGLESFDEAKINADLAPDFAELRRLNGEMAGLESYREVILKEGMSKNIGIGLEHLAPGVLNNIKLSMLTEAPSTNKMDFALESIDWRSKITKIAIVIVVVGIIIKMLSWIISLGKVAPTTDSNSGRKIAENVSKQREQLVKRIKEEVHDAKVFPAAYMIDNYKSEHPWLRPTMSLMTKMIREGKLDQEMAISFMQFFEVYINMDYPGVRDKNDSLAIIFPMIIKNKLRIDYGSLGFYITDDKSGELDRLGYPPFARNTMTYTEFKIDMNKAVINLTKIMSNGNDAVAKVENDIRRANDRSPEAMAQHALTLQSAVGGYFKDLEDCFDFVFGDGYKQPAFDFVKANMDSKDAGKFMDRGALKHHKFDPKAAFAKQPQTYPGQPSGLYNHGEWVKAAYSRGTTDYEIFASGGQHNWWDAGFDEQCLLGTFDLYYDPKGLGRPDITVFQPNSKEVMAWIMRMLEDTKSIEDFIRVSDARMGALGNEFTGKGIKVVEDMISSSKKLLAELKVMEGKSKSGIPTIWDVRWFESTGLHFDRADWKGNRESRIDSTFGEASEHLLRGLQAQLNAFMKTKVVYEKIKIKYLAFRNALQSHFGVE